MSANKKSGARILGIDPGFDRVGVAIVEGARGKEQLVFSECIETNRKEPHEKRLAQIAREIETIIKKFKPDTIAIEKMFFNQNTNNALKVAEARGVILALAGKNKMPVYEYSPQQVKAGITGYGKATKNDLIFLISKIIKIPPTSGKRLDDEYDAISVALTHSAVGVHYYPQ